jgi:O-antigen/teichoic acid export membrane protein
MRHSNEKIIQNTFLFTASLIIQKIFSFSYFWFISSRLSPEAIGTYTWVLSYGALCSIGMDFGLASILAREAAKDEDRSEMYLRAVYSLKLPLVILTSVALWVVYFFLPHSSETTALLVIANIVIALDAFTPSAYSILRARQNLRYESAAYIVSEFLVLSIGIISISLTRNIFFLLIAILAAISFNFLFSNYILWRRFRFNLSPKFDKETAKHFLRLAPAFALGGIFTKIYNSADSVLLGYLANKTAVGLYSIPAKVTTALQALIPGAFAASIYPSMANYFVTSREKLRDLFLKSTSYLFMLSLPIAFGLFVLTPSILNVIWPQYIGAKNAFRVMVLGLPFVFACFPSGSLLNACDSQRKNMLNRGIITVVNILVNFALIPILGAEGAAIAFVVSNIALFVLDFWFARQVVDYSLKALFFVFVKSGVAAAVMAFVLYYLRNEINLILAVAIGAAVYFVILVLLGGVSRQDYMAVKNLLSKKSLTPEKAESLYDEEKSLNHN